MSTTFSRSFRFFLFDAEIRHSFLLYDKVYDLARNNDLLYDLLALDGVLYLFLCHCGIDRSLLVGIDCQLDGALQLAVYLYRQLYRALDGLGLIIGRPRATESRPVSPSCCHSSSVICGANGLSSARKVLYSALFTPLS